jgi:hypothetical protein
MFSLFLFAFQDTRFTYPGPIFTYIAMGLIAAGIIGWLLAVVVGLPRAKQMGPGGRWFALSALCVLLFHIHLLAFGVILGIATVKKQDPGLAMKVGFFFNAFIVLGAFCALIGFARSKPATVSPQANSSTTD